MYEIGWENRAKRRKKYNRKNQIAKLEKRDLKIANRGMEKRNLNFHTHAGASFTLHNDLTTPANTEQIRRKLRANCGRFAAGLHLD